MPKKFTYQFVKEYLDSYGYILLERDYQNSSTPLKIKCPEKHLIYMRFDHFKNGHRCNKCYGNNVKTIEEVRDAFLEYGYTILENDYKNNRQKLKCLCPNGHQLFVRWGDFFNKGVRCVECSGRMRNDYECIKEYVEGEGYTLLSEEYINSWSKIKLMCQNGHSWHTTWNSFQSGHRCIVCSGKNKMTIDQVREEFKLHGLLLVSDTYINNSTKLEALCDKGHSVSITWNGFINGSRCRKCSSLSTANKLKLDIEFVKDEFKKVGYELLTEEYRNNRQLLKFLCNVGHINYIRWNNFQQGQRCSSCSHIVSREEENLFSLVIGLLGSDNVVRNTRTVIPPYELDIYIPSKNLAIEYCGSHWHGEFNGGKNRSYHRNKFDRCESLGIRLITLFEHNYLHDVERAIKRLNHIICSPNYFEFEPLEKSLIKIDLNWGRNKTIPGLTLVKECKYNLVYLCRGSPIEKKDLKAKIGKIPVNIDEWKKINKENYIDRLWECGYRVYRQTNTSKGETKPNE